MHLESFFPYRLALAAEAFSRNLASVYTRDHGLSREEWRILAALEGIGTMTSTDIARRTTLDKVQVCRAAARLENKGYISRGISREDRRLRDFELTREGRAELRRLVPKVNRRVEELLGALDPQARASLVDGLDALLDAMDISMGARTELDEPAAHSRAEPRA